MYVRMYECMNVLALSVTWNSGSFFYELLPSLLYFFCFIPVRFFDFLKKAFLLQLRSNDMLILNLKTAKQSEHTPLSIYHLHSGKNKNTGNINS